MTHPAEKYTPKPSPIIELRIQFDQSNGNVNVHGPLQNRMLCYGMLEMAREIIYKQGAQQKSKAGSIVVPQIGIKGI